MAKQLKAVMMAGGFGSRIQPLTNSVPKPMLPIINVPMMEHILYKLIDLGIEEVVILLYFKPDVIKEHFGDGSRWGVTIHYVLPDDDYGTAGAVGCAREFLDTTFLIVSGDLVTDFDLDRFVDYHREKESKLSITLTSVEDPLQFGVVIANEEGRIEKFLEKPSWGEVFSDTINTGLYLIEPEILDYIPEGKDYDFGKNLFPQLMQEGVPLMGYTAEGYWRDVGNPESYREVYDDILNERVQFTIRGEKTDYPDGALYCEESCLLDPSIEIVGKVIIGKNVTVDKGTKLVNVVLGDNVTVGKDCKLRNTVIWRDTVIEKGVILDNCVICNNNVIGKNSKAKAGLVLAENCEVGSLVSFEQDVTIWPNKQIADAAIVSNNVVWGSRFKNSIFEDGTVTGTSNVELSCDMATKLAESFGSKLPKGSTVYVSRDDVKSSRMLKRAFLGGLLSTGVNVVDVKSMMPAMMRYNLAHNDNVVAGIHFRQSINDQTHTQIIFFNDEGLRIDGNTAKSVEKAFFRETFRRVDYSEIGEILEPKQGLEKRFYKNAITSSPAKKEIKSGHCRVAYDLMHGLTKAVLPELLTEMGIDSILLNSYPDERRTANLKTMAKKSRKDISDIVGKMGLDMGFIIYPNGMRLLIVSDDGEILDKEKALYCYLYLLNMEAKAKETKKEVFLPSWAPDAMDTDMEYLNIARGKYANFKRSQLDQYEMIATLDGNYAFSEFSVHRDSIYASMKLIELYTKHNIKLSEIVKNIKPFYYYKSKVPCTQALKGKMMRMFLQDAKGYRSSSVDGVKIWKDTIDWILMIPDQYSDNLNLYIQAKDEIRGKALCEEYETKIKEWAK